MKEFIERFNVFLSEVKAGCQTAHVATVRIPAAEAMKRESRVDGEPVPGEQVIRARKYAVWVN